MTVTKGANAELDQMKHSEHAMQGHFTMSLVVSYK